MIIFFLKSHQIDLFDAPVPIKAHSTKTGGYVRAHTRIMKVSAKTPKQQKPMDLDFENVANLINNMHNTPDNQQKTGEKKMETTPKRKRLKNENESLVDFITNNINDLLFDEKDYYHDRIPELNEKLLLIGEDKLKDFQNRFTLDERKNMTLQSIVSILHNVVLDGDKKERDQAVKVLKLLAAHDAAHKQADKDAAMNAIKNAQLPVGYSAELISRPLAGTAISEGDFIKVSGKFDDKMNLRIKAAGGAWDRAPAKIAGNPTLVLNTVATGSKSWLIPAAKADKFLKQFS